MAENTGSTAGRGMAPAGNSIPKPDNTAHGSGNSTMPSKGGNETYDVVKNPLRKFKDSSGSKQDYATTTDAKGNPVKTYKTKGEYQKEQFERNMKKYLGGGVGTNFGSPSGGGGSSVGGGSGGGSRGGPTVIGNPGIPPTLPGLDMNAFGNFPQLSTSVDQMMHVYGGSAFLRGPSEFIR